jgi:hypothetical protein
MSDLVPAFKLLLSVLLWIVLCCVGPREFMRRSVSQHYREWVPVRAYWGRAYDKWIIGNRVFYTDEFWGDLFFSVFAGAALNFAYFYVLTQIASEHIDLPILLAAAASTPIILFLTRQYDRCQVSDEEVDRKQRIDPSFSGEAEMKRLLTSDQKFVRRIIGRHAAMRTRVGE